MRPSLSRLAHGPVWKWFSTTSVDHREQAGQLYSQGIKIYFEGGQVTRVDGGGAGGKNIREALERFKNVQYPGYYPGPG